MRALQPRLEPLEARMAQARKLAWEAPLGLPQTGERFTKKQMGDAGEMLVAAELTLHGLPAFIVPSQWRGYDVVAQCSKRGLQRLSVKTRNFARSGNFVCFAQEEDFDWLAIVILPATARYKRRIFIVPRDVAHRRSYESPYWSGRGFHVHKIIRWPASRLPEHAPIDCGLADYEDNFRLNAAPRSKPRTNLRQW